MIESKSFDSRASKQFPSISIERALLETEFYKAHFGKYSTPVMRAMFFKHLCEKKTLYIGKDELIVGERGPVPKSVPTFPELICHTGEDLKILNNRDMTPFKISEADINIYETQVLPYWKGRSLRDRIFDRFLRSGRPHIRPVYLRNSWNNELPGTPPLMTLSIKRECSILNRRSLRVYRRWIISKIRKRPTRQKC